MKKSASFGILVLTTIILALSFCVAFAGYEKDDATLSINTTNTATNITMPLIKTNATTNITKATTNWSSLDSPAPVEVGKEYDVEIEAIAREGDGIAMVEGFVIFVADAKIGDAIKIQIDKVTRRFAIGHKV